MEKPRKKRSGKSMIHMRRRKPWAVVVDVGNDKLILSSFNERYQAEGEAWRVRKYQCRPARVVEIRA